MESKQLLIMECFELFLLMIESREQSFLQDQNQLNQLILAIRIFSPDFYALNTHNAAPVDFRVTTIANGFDLTTTS